jgi:hypothetical protein
VELQRSAHAAVGIDDGKQRFKLARLGTITA